MSIANEKQALRTTIKARIAAIPNADKAPAGTAINHRIGEICQSHENILLFSPLPDEPAIGDLFDLGSLVCLPRYLLSSESYEAAVIADPAKDLITGKFGILEPKPQCKSLSLKHLDLVLVPGVAFAPCGARLGRGRGFYDRILKSASGRKIGVAFDEQIVEAIPSEAHDERVDGIITPTRWIEVG